MNYLNEVLSVNEVQVDDDVVRDVGDGGWFGKALVGSTKILKHRKRWNEKEVTLSNFSSGFVVYTNQANPFWIYFWTRLPFQGSVEF